MISQKLNEQINVQMKNEFYSAYFYLAMAAWFTSKNLPGFANWFTVQAQEERDHATMMMNYLLRVGADVKFLPIEAPDSNFESPLDVCQKTLAHEQQVTKWIYGIMDTAQEERDYKTIQFLQWFVTEQVEEEENASGLIERLKSAGTTEAGLLYLDNEAGTRVYVQATGAAN